MMSEDEIMLRAIAGFWQDFIKYVGNLSEAEMRSIAEEIIEEKRLSRC